MSDGFITRRGGSGGILNFVKAYASEADLPATAKENTIAVFTDTAISSYVLSPEEPTDLIEGMVWIQTGLSSAVAFSVTKKNPIMVYPLSAKQYVGGVWVDRTANSYQNGEWVSWWNGELYDSGDEFETFTGGWSARAWAHSSAYVNNSKAPTLAKNGDNMRLALSTNNSQASGAIEVGKDINVTGFTKLTAIFTSINFTGQFSSSQNKGAGVYLCIVPRDAATFNADAVASAMFYKTSSNSSFTDITLEVELSNVTGVYDIVVGISVSSVSSATASAAVTSVKLI